ncbi:MAG: hypothetical protein JWQ01_4811 [Massilia sp.]|nr:hypothetical protein [Massilia sp.]
MNIPTPQQAPGPLAPTYYVRHPDDSYSVADPQPGAQQAPGPILSDLRAAFEAAKAEQLKPLIAHGMRYRNPDGSFQVGSIEIEFRAWADGYHAALALAAVPGKEPVERMPNLDLAAFENAISNLELIAQGLAISKDHDLDGGHVGATITHAKKMATAVLPRFKASYAELCGSLRSARRESKALAAPVGEVVAAPSDALKVAMAALGQIASPQDASLASSVVQAAIADRTLAIIAALKGGEVVAAPPEPKGLACWSCKRPYTQRQWMNADGDCPHCGVEIEDEGGEVVVATDLTMSDVLEYARKRGFANNNRQDAGRILGLGNDIAEHIRVANKPSLTATLSKLQRWFNSEFGVEKFSAVQHKNMPDVPTYFLASDVERLFAALPPQATSTGDTK